MACERQSDEDAAARASLVRIMEKAKWIATSGRQLIACTLAVPPVRHNNSSRGCPIDYEEQT